MTNITGTVKKGLLKQIQGNNMNILRWTGRVNGAATTTHAEIGHMTFPYKIRVLSTSLVCSEAAATGFAVTLTDGTNALVSTLATSSTKQVDAQDQTYAADATLSVKATITAAVSSMGSYSFDYIIDERQDI